jgi:hypothetical protein
MSMEDRSRSHSGSPHGHSPPNMMVHQGPQFFANMSPSFELSAADNMKHLVQDCGVSPHKVAELLQELPPPRFSAALVDFYFSSVYARCSTIATSFLKRTQELDPVPDL